MACDASNDAKVRVAIGTWDRIIQVWKIDPKGVLSAVFSVKLGATLPKALGFADNTAKDVYVFGLYNSFMYVS
jgi:hypothetical protein